MQPPEPAQDEPLRLRVLRERGILDTPPEERFDRLTRLARHMFGTPIALVSLVDADRQWFKSSQGLDARETGRDVSFCGHAILGDDIFEVGDARLDPRFADNPLVTGGPRIRFYAGAPLGTPEGLRIGTLCIISDQPRVLSAEERKALRDLADCVEAEINQSALKQQSRALKQAQRLGQVIARAQSQFIQEPDRRKAFDGLLTDILELTESEYGFIGEVLHAPDGAPYLKTYAISNIAWNEATHAFYEAHAPRGMEFRNLKTLFGAALVSGEPVISNEPAHDSRRGGLPDGHPALNAFLGVPVHHGDELVAMVGVSNRPGGYDQALVDFLQPLLVTLGQLVVAARIRQQHQEDQVEIARLSRVASQTTNGVVITDAAGKVEWINEGFSRITGYTLAEMRGRKPGEILQGEATNPATVARMREALARGRSFDEDVINYTRSGQPYWVHISCNPLLDEAGGLAGFMAIESDIDQQKQTETKLAEFKRTLDRTLDCVFMFDATSLRFFYVNEGALRQLDYTRDELLSMHPYDIKPDISEAAFHARIAPLLAGKMDSLTYETDLARRDGERVPVEIFLQYIAPEGEMPRFVAIVRDMSERKRVERMKREFVSTVSHELRTPLTSISGALGLLSGGALGALPEPIADLVGIAHQNSQRLAYLINDLLDMEKLLAGRMRFDMRPHALTPLLEQAIRDVRAYAEQNKVSFVLKDSADDIVIEADSQRFEQIMANLLSNAAKFSPEGSVVDIGVHRLTESVRIEVTDRGPGIPAEFRERIFQKFSQADASDSRQRGGTGLGLAITRELVERMGGRIGFVSTEGAGATFFFELPVLTVRTASRRASDIETDPA